MQHFYAIALDSISHYFNHDLRHLIRALRKKKKKVYSTITGQIRNSLLFLSFINKNIRSRLLIPLFSDLAIPVLAYCCTAIANYDFVLCFYI